MSERSGSSLRVLVIDDQKSMRSIIRGLLYQFGVEDIDEADGGEGALEFLLHPRSKFPDVIICDLHMGKMDGMQFCNAVRRNDNLRNRHVPIIILTGDQDSFMHEVVEQVGALKVVTKPVSADELRQHIGAAVGFSIAS